MTNDRKATEPHGEFAAPTAPHGGEKPILDPQTVSDRIAADGRAAFPMRTAMLVALAVFAIESTWSFYDSQVPPLIQEYVGSAAVIGLLMGMDNVLGIFLHPWIGNRSDRTRTRLGRRIPYLLAFAPVAALAFVLLPFAGSAVVLFVLIIVYALTANLLKPLAEALLPDFLPVAHRSLGTAVVKVGGSLAIVIAAVISLLLVDDHPKLAFAVPAAIMLVAIAIVALRLRERSSIGYRTALVNDEARVESRKDVRMIEVLRGLFSAPGHSALMLLFSTFLFLGAWTGQRALLTPYGVEALGLTRGQAGGLPILAGLVFLVTAYPTALISRRFGKLPSALLGIGLFCLSMLVATVIPDRTVTTVALVVAAVGYGAFIINAVVLWWDFAPTQEVLGTFTGIWTGVLALAGTLGPAIVGALVDLTDWRWMLLDVAALSFISLIPLAIVARTLKNTKEHHE